MKEKFNISKLFYFIQSILKYFSKKNCPSCWSDSYKVVDRKYKFTKLLECQECYLRYRHPLDTEKFNEKFYQKKYHQTDGITTDLPDENQLNNWIKTDFKDSNKSALLHIEIIKALLGDVRQKRILDYGASWGYTSWQFKTHGLLPFCYEISKHRAEFGKKWVSIIMIHSLILLINMIFFIVHM